MKEPFGPLEKVKPVFLHIILQKYIDVTIISFLKDAHKKIKNDKIFNFYWRRLVQRAQPLIPRYREIPGSVSEFRRKILRKLNDLVLFIYRDKTKEHQGIKKGLLPPQPVSVELARDNKYNLQSNQQPIFLQNEQGNKKLSYFHIQLLSSHLYILLDCYDGIFRCGVDCGHGQPGSSRYIYNLLLFDNVKYLNCNSKLFY